MKASKHQELELSWATPPSPLTIVLLPNQNKRSEANKEHSQAHNCFPLVGAPVHLSEALIKLDSVH